MRDDAALRQAGTKNANQYHRLKIKPAIRFAAVALLFAAIILPVFTTQAGGSYLNGSAFIKGANMPWIDAAFYNDLATNPHYPASGSAYNAAHMNSDLADLHRMGVTVVRFWLNTDDQGCLLDSNGFVIGVTNQFWTNLDNLLSIAGSNGISLYLTLNNGRSDWLTNTAMANAYKTNCVIPLIQRYKGSTNIFGIDLMNELDAWVADPTYGNPWISSGATWAQAKAYITNLGMFGVEEFSAIINPPEASILAVGAVRETVIVSGGTMRPGRVMTMTLSADHRIIDGAVADQFMAHIKRYLESSDTSYV